MRMDFGTESSTPFSPPPLRLLKQYEAQVAAEGELTEEELPEEILDQVEGNVSNEQQHYVVRRPCLRL